MGERGDGGAMVMEVPWGWSCSSDGGIVFLEQCVRVLPCVCERERDRSCVFSVLWAALHDI